MAERHLDIMSDEEEAKIKLLSHPSLVTSGKLLNE